MSLFRSTTSTTVAPPEIPDVEVANPPSDSISSLAFSSAGNFLAAGSWDNKVRIYEINDQKQSQGRAMYEHQGPVLDLYWNKEGSKIVSAGVDNAARVYDLQTGQATQVAQHDAPIKSVRWFETPQVNGGLVATGSWDKTLKYWDLRSSTPVLNVALPERCYSMDVVYPLLTVGCADRQIRCYDLSNPSVVSKEMISPLKFQIRSVACFPGADGFTVGSVEGRIAVHSFPGDESKRYTFRCHRQETKPGLKDGGLVYAVNDIKYNPVHGTFASVGSDGQYCFWDGDNRQRLKSSPQATVNASISTCAFNRDSTIFAYALSYDWHKGHQGMTPEHPNKIMLHTCRDEEVKRRAAAPKR
ncbi:WD40 repeat-like protein [Schizopora paradoxa]|uniref:WD40 repeat-like protein n=1 Tax=Schizopora paradoxa TaxID=27342 RepID=A0A0H2SC70_9AGAM|nr:WD40 repeat-like protein [Schizopora paradoxa]